MLFVIVNLTIIAMKDKKNVLTYNFLFMFPVYLCAICYQIKTKTPQNLKKKKAIITLTYK